MKEKCDFIDICGGCQFNHLDYNGQTEFKNNYIQKLLGEFGEVLPIIPMENPYHYRNKVLRTFQKKGKNGIESGIYAKGTHKLVPIENCIIENQGAQEILNSITKLARDFKMEAFDEDTGRGLLRHALVRWAHTTGEYMVILVLANSFFKGKNNFIKALVKKHPEIMTVVINYNKRKTSVVLEGKLETAYGPGFIYDILCGLKFKLSPSSFYQVNSIQTEILYNKAIELAEFTKNDRVLDAYCGIGTIGLITSSKVKEVVGVESNFDAIRDAEINKKLNKINNIKFIKADATEYIVSQSKGSFNKITMDPPRAGSTEEFLQSVIKIAPEKIIYVSCNPETLKRDLEYLINNYRVEVIQPVDMFPFTDHIECVVRIQKTS